MCQAGADFIFIAGHICANEMHELAPLAAELGVDVIGGGHCHQQVVEEQSGIPLVQSTSYLMGYNKVEVLVDTDADAVVESRSDAWSNCRGRASSSRAQSRSTGPSSVGWILKIRFASATVRRLLTSRFAASWFRRTCTTAAASTRSPSTTAALSSPISTGVTPSSTGCGGSRPIADTPWTSCWVCRLNPAPERLRRSLR
jgi:hypothetical protein